MNAKRIPIIAGLMLVISLSTAPAQQDVTINDTSVRVIKLEDINYTGATVNAQGVVVVRVTLDDKGNVATAKALSGVPILILLSIDNVKKWHFAPNSERVAIVVYNFRVKGFCDDGRWPSQMIFYPPNFADVTACGQPPSALLSR
jgi:hypothetical protein